MTSVYCNLLIREMAFIVQINIMKFHSSLLLFLYAYIILCSFENSFLKPYIILHYFCTAEYHSVIVIFVTSTDNNYL